MERPDIIPIPDQMVKWMDIFKGLGEVAIQMVTKQFLHQGISEHGVKPTIKPPTN